MSCSKASCSAPTPCGSSVSTSNWYSPRGFVDIDAAARQHRQAVLRLELPVAVRGAEGHALHLGVALLEGEIVVAAGGQLQAGDLARHPDVRELRVERRADGGVQLADGEDAALRRQVEFQRELLHETIVGDMWGQGFGLAAGLLAGVPRAQRETPSKLAATSTGRQERQYQRDAPHAAGASDLPEGRGGESGRCRTEISGIPRPFSALFFIMARFARVSLFPAACFGW